MQELIHIHKFYFDDLSIITEFYNNKDGEFFTNQEIILSSCNNSASINLSGTQLTADRLQNLANELRIAEHDAKVKLLDTKK